MPGEQVSCTSTARGPLVAPPVDEATHSPQTQAQEGSMMMARVGKAAPDFEAMGYIDGGFKRYKLSDYAGEWVLVCFYPGDFTFV